MKLLEPFRGTIAKPFIRTGTGGFRARTASQNPLIRWALGHTWHTDTIAKPLYQDRNWWIPGPTPRRKTPLSFPVLVGFGMEAGRACAAGFSNVILQHCLKGLKDKAFLRLSRDRKRGGIALPQKTFPKRCYKPEKPFEKFLRAPMGRPRDRRWDANWFEG